MADFLLITTGGTMDAEPYAIEDTPEVITPLVQSLVPQALAQMGVEGFDYLAFPPADSKEFPEEDGRLEKLTEAILNNDHERVLVTHGTDVLSQNTNAIYRAWQDSGSSKRVVFACAMVPLANTRAAEGYAFEESDGYHSIARAVQELRKPELAAGIHISANGGRFFEGNTELPRVRKEFNTPSPDQRFFYLID